MMRIMAPAQTKGKHALEQQFEVESLLGVIAAVRIPTSRNY